MEKDKGSGRWQKKSARVGIFGDRACFCGQGKRRVNVLFGLRAAGVVAGRTSRRAGCTREKASRRAQGQGREDHAPHAISPPDSPAERPLPRHWPVRNKNPPARRGIGRTANIGSIVLGSTDGAALALLVAAQFYVVYGTVPPIQFKPPV